MYLFRHPARNARIALRISKTGKYEEKEYQIHRSPGREFFFPTTFLSMAQNVNLLTE